MACENPSLEWKQPTFLIDTTQFSLTSPAIGTHSQWVYSLLTSGTASKESPMKAQRRIFDRSGDRL